MALCNDYKSFLPFKYQITKTLGLEELQLTQIIKNKKSSDGGIGLAQWSSSHMMKYAGS